MKILSKDELINKAGDLKVLPFVARKALEILNDENCSIEDLSAVIEKDQTIAARILKISNSALYGLRMEVTSLQHALLILGFKTLRSIVLTATTRALYKKFGMTEKIIWDHSVGAAVAAKLISRGLGNEVTDIAFVGGLMHDLGKVIMNNETPEIYSEVMMKMYNEGVDSIIAERDIYGYDHSEVGAGVTGKWKFASSLVTVLKEHHLNNCRLEDIKDPVTAKGIACVHLADHICKVLGIGYREAEESIILHELPSAVYLNLGKDKLDKLVNEISETYNSEKSVFE
ncbi:MAG: HDOD domain-containing protein [Nitrospirae bacterium]|nr:HDOD domain-containing protein [Nitrospirota bacterium]